MFDADFNIPIEKIWEQIFMIFDDIFNEFCQISLNKRQQFQNSIYTAWKLYLNMGM